MLDVAPAHLALVRDILATHVPDATVRVFGSRTDGTARPHSDLDLAIDAGRPLDLGTLAHLEEAFQESDLPFRVDVVDWQRVSGPFRERIRASALAL